ncbi:DUF2177 family protein [Candidatus Nomurabacteria bacterium]|nr:DUF2177 family protein [Candidatus Nomurabacteria bacterium]
MDFIKMYLVSLVSFLALDSVWLGFIAPKFYKKNIGFIMSQNPNFLAAGLFYLIFMVGLVVFVIQPAISDGSWYTALYRGALFGLVSYATFDLTNQAVIKNWPWLVTGVDLLWGTFITGLVSVVAYLILQKFVL